MTYTVHWIDSMGAGFVHHASAAEVTQWAQRNGRVLGKAGLHLPTFEVTCTEDGSRPPRAVLEAIQPQRSESLYFDREVRALAAIGGDGAVQFAIGLDPMSLHAVGGYE